jgi:hypothetical protein
MKFTTPLVFLSALSSVIAAVPVPKGTGIATVDIPNWGELRIYHQDAPSSGIKEITTKLPTTGVLNDGFIFTGATRSNTPLAAISWASGKDDPEVSRPNSHSHAGITSKYQGRNNIADIQRP